MVMLARALAIPLVAVGLILQRDTGRGVPIRWSGACAIQSANIRHRPRHVGRELAT